VGRPAYSLAWADFGGDGDLDLVTATYDAGMLTDRGNEYLLGNSGGVYVYTNHEGRFRPVQLATEAQGLALLVFDADNDGRPDLLVGNDFNLRDMAFRNTPDGWRRDAWPAPTWEGPIARAKAPFAQTTHSTMSLDAADVHNDGRSEVFATDMKPVNPRDHGVAVAWAPLMADMNPPLRNGVPDPYDPQIMENVLLVRDDSGIYYNVAPHANVDATGWSWSGRFGDLDLDGYVDLYVVNGFTEERLLGHLENHELVEENQALRNDGMGRFVEQPQWGLDSTRSGRSMLMADMDGDGDLDIVVNNVRAPAQLFENQLCRLGSAVEIALVQPGVQNRNALGARVRVYTSDGIVTREVRSGAGYLTGEPPLVSLGLAPAMQVQRIEITWPDGARSTLDSLPLDARVTITRLEPH
jgi:enediyne biosynthesis protein E4